MNYLVFRLYGAMASWGEAAVGGDRPTALHPTRSALLGLLCAALGIKRTEEERIQQLNEQVNVAIKQYSPGVLQRDYHTAQVPSEDKKRILYTRKDELSAVARNKLNTVLSNRDYRVEGLWVVAISLAENNDYTLEQLQQALLRPKFTLYLGRKSCPLAAPLQPVLVDGELKQALDTDFDSIFAASGNYAKLSDEQREKQMANAQKQQNQWLKLPTSVSYFWQGDKDALGIEEAAVQTLDKWDQPGHRKRRQFSQRVEHSVTLASQ